MLRQGKFYFVIEFDQGQEFLCRDRVFLCRDRFLFWARISCRDNVFLCLDKVLFG